MSYRHSSYRKMSRILLSVQGMPAVDANQALKRHEMDRVLVWSNQPPLPKRAGWGKPKSQRAA